MWGGGKEVRSEKAAGMEGGLRAAAGCMASLQGRPPPSRACSQNPSRQDSGRCWGISELSLEIQSPKQGPSLLALHAMSRALSQRPWLRLPLLLEGLSPQAHLSFRTGSWCLVYQNPGAGFRGCAKLSRKCSDL